MITLFLVVTLVALVVAFILTPRSWRLFHMGTHTEYAGTGRVRFVSFFRGAGYCVPVILGRGWDGKPLNAPGWRPNLRIRGFTIYVRTRASSTKPYRTHGAPVRRVRITTNPNQPIC